MKDLGNLRYFLGIEVARSPNEIVMNHRRFCLKMISNVCLKGSKPIKTLMELGLKLTSVDYAKLFNLNKEDRVMDDVTAYKISIGKLLYLMVVNPDISFCVQQLSQFLQQPKQ